MPSILTLSSMWRIASTAAASAASLSPRPIIREAPSAAASVTRTSSSARLRSGGVPAARSLTAAAYTPGHEQIQAAAGRGETITAPACHG